MIAGSISPLVANATIPDIRVNTRKTEITFKNFFLVTSPLNLISDCVSVINSVGDYTAAV